MNVAVLGSGVVGRTLSAKLEECGHKVVVGTRDVDNLLARTERSMGGRLPPFSESARREAMIPLTPLGTTNRASSSN